MAPDAVFPLILGTDISGAVAAVGEGVSGFAVGDEVYSMVRFPEAIMTGSGAYAEYVIVPASELALKPAGIGHVEAAGAPMSLLTAWQFLIDLGHEAPNPFQSFTHQPVPLAGKTVVVNGAGGVSAISRSSWQNGRARASSPSPLAGMKLSCAISASISSSIIIKLRPRMWCATPIWSSMRWGTSIDRFLRSIRRGGALFLVNPLGFTSHAEAEELGITVSVTQVRSNGAQLAQAGRLLADGTVKVIVDSTFPLAEAARAHERAAKGNIQGKIALTVA
jgi:NADPH:quinone reductase-like Zn-dependent oxidoreductase